MGKDIKCVFKETKPVGDMAGPVVLIANFYKATEIFAAMWTQL